MKEDTWAKRKKSVKENLETKKRLEDTMEMARKKFPTINEPANEYESRNLEQTMKNREENLRKAKEAKEMRQVFGRKSDKSLEKIKDKLSKYGNEPLLKEVPPPIPKDAGDTPPPIPKDARETPPPIHKDTKAKPREFKADYENAKIQGDGFKRRYEKAIETPTRIKNTAKGVGAGLAVMGLAELVDRTPDLQVNIKDAGKGSDELPEDEQKKKSFVNALRKKK